MAITTDEGLPSLQDHLINQGLGRQTTDDTINAIMDAMRDSSQGTDWTPDDDFDGMEIDSEGRRQMDGLEIPDGDNGEPEADNSDIEIDYASGEMSDEKAKEEAEKLFGMANIAKVKITKEMIEEQFGRNGAQIWTELVATSILDRILIPSNLAGKQPGELKTFYEEQTGRGVQMYQRKHKVASSISQWGKYLPSTWFGQSRSSPSPFRRRSKDEGGAGFHICIDVSGSNGSITDPNSNMNAVVTTACAIIEEARVMDYPISLYLNPNLNGGWSNPQIPADSPLLDPYLKYPVMVKEGFDFTSMKATGKTVQIKLAPAIDPRFYYYQTKEYDEVIRKLTTKITADGCETPRAVFGRLTYDLKKARDETKNKDKQTVIWIADCTRVQEYLTCPSMFECIKEVGEMWIFCISGSRNKEMIDFFGEGMNDRRYADYVTFIDIPNYKRGSNPDTIPKIIAEKLGLKHVQISEDNRLRKLV